MAICPTHHAISLPAANIIHGRYRYTQDLLMLAGTATPHPTHTWSMYRCRRLYGPPSAWTPGPSTLGCLDPRSNYPRVDGPPRSMYTRVDGPLPGWLDPPLVADFLTSQNVRASLYLAPASHSLGRIRG